MSQEKESAEKIIDSWFKLPNLIKKWLKQALFFGVSVGVFIGGIMVVWGAIKWATRYGRTNGRTTMIRGIALIVLSIAPTFFT